MGRDDWYRSTTWTPEIRDAFEAKLRRSRGAIHKAQYVTIQAGSLASSDDPATVAAALALFDRVLAEFPGETWNEASVHAGRANCLVSLGRTDDALDALRASLAAQRREPNFRHPTHLKFARLAIDARRTDLYPEARLLLDEFCGDEIFPASIFDREAARAVLAAEEGKPAAAALHARIALNAAAQRESPFRYHRKLGLVHDPDAELMARLAALAALAKPE